MDYTKHYNALVDKASNRTLTGYKERHHIIPRCMGGTDDPSNLIDLTAEEHFVAHQLLLRMFWHTEYKHKLAWACQAMSMGRTGRVLNNKSFGWLRKAFAQAVSAKNKGRKRAPFSAETRKKLSDAKTGKKLPDTTREKMSLAKKGKPVSEERRKAMTESRIGKTQSAATRKKLSDAKKGKAQRKVICPHCGKEGGVNLMPRHHFDKCKKYQKNDKPL